MFREAGGSRLAQEQPEQTLHTTAWFTRRNFPRRGCFPRAAKARREPSYDGRKLISSSTAALQDFVLRHKDRFTGEFSLERDATE